MLAPPTPWKACVFAAAYSRCASSSCCLVFCEDLSGWAGALRLVLKPGAGRFGVVEHHRLALLAIVGAWSCAGFAWWWIQKKRAASWKTR